jgi:hypothetical protein
MANADTPWRVWRPLPQRWAFKPRFRAQAFGCEPEPAVAAVEEAVAEILGHRERDPVFAAEGGVGFLMRVSPALEVVDASTGAIGAAVDKAIATLTPLIAGAPANAKKRERWIERLFAAHAADRVPFLVPLGERFGELCGNKALASVWAERLLPYTRKALEPEEHLRGHFHGTVPCLSALFHAERYDELLALVEVDAYWPYRRWAMRAMLACGKKAEALRLAEGCRPMSATPQAIDQASEAILLSSGLWEQAYKRYALRANLQPSMLATYLALREKYPQRAAQDILVDLGEADPHKLARAAIDHAHEDAEFGIEAGLLALEWWAVGSEPPKESSEVLAVYRTIMRAADELGESAEVRARVDQLMAESQSGVNLVRMALILDR